MSEVISMDNKARQMMTPEQAELSAARQRHIEACPDIKRLGTGFNAVFDVKSWATGFLSNEIEGSIDGEAVYVTKKSFGESHPWRYENKREDKAALNGDAQAIFDGIEPVARAFVDMRKEEGELERGHALTRRRARLALEEVQRLEKIAAIQELIRVETEKILNQLGECTEVLDRAAEEDEGLLKEAVQSLATSRVDKNGELGLGYSVVMYLSGVAWRDGNDKDYSRIKGQLLDLFGVNKDVEPKKWADPIFGFAHSEVYDTKLPEVIIRESYHHQETGHDYNGNRAVLRIEDNPDKDSLRLAARTLYY